jgi:starch synthase
MRIMTRHCGDPGVTAVHAYEDCSLWQFREAKRRGKFCIYDMPIGYYPVWESIETELKKRYNEWLPEHTPAVDRQVSTEHKREEMELADLVIAPCSFAERTIRAHFPEKKIATAHYGVDLDFWTPGLPHPPAESLRFIYAGQLSLRKGTPLLLEAWQKAGLRRAELELVGSWQLAEAKRSTLPSNVSWRPPCSSLGLRDYYRRADVFVFPSYFEGFGLVLGEALACGLPVICSDATAGPDIVTEQCGRVVPAGDLDTLIESLRWFDGHRSEIPAMRQAARAVAQGVTWENYRSAVTDAVQGFL